MTLLYDKLTNINFADMYPASSNSLDYCHDNIRVEELRFEIFKPGPHQSDPHLIFCIDSITETLNAIIAAKGEISPKLAIFLGMPRDLPYLINLAEQKILGLSEIEDRCVSMVTRMGSWDYIPYTNRTNIRLDKYYTLYDQIFSKAYTWLKLNKPDIYVELI